MSKGKTDREKRVVNLPALVSVTIAGALVFVGTARVISYSDLAIGNIVRNRVLGFLAYKPDNYLDVRYFKILATWSAISLVYFLFRIFNRGHRSVSVSGYRTNHRDLDFRSPWLRLVLLVVINSYWAVQEWYKFTTMSFPYSPLENWQSNAAVLAISALIAFIGMRYFSFRPLLAGRDV